jgi:glucan-binding YG repeat protein
MSTSLKTLTSSLIAKLPRGIDEYFYMREWYSDGDEFASGKFLNNGSTVQTGLSLREHKEILTIAKEASESLKQGDVNRVYIVFQKNGSYVDIAEFIETLDMDREKDIRSEIGNELYNKLEQDRRNFKEPEDEQAILNQQESSIEPEETSTPEDGSTMTEQELFSFLYQELNQAVPEGWEKIIVDVHIFVDDNDMNNINTDYNAIQAGSDQSILFTPGNVFGAMNAFSRLKELMTEQGAPWEKAVFTFHRDGSIEMKVE